MRTISASALLLALAAPASAQGAVGAAACPAHLGTIAPRLQASGFHLRWAGSAMLIAAYVRAPGQITIEYACGAEGLDVAIVNHGMPDIPFQVLMAAGPGARLSHATPAWLRDREKAVRD